MLEPEFPNLHDARSISATETAVPNSWLFELAEYRIRIEEVFKTYSDIKKFYEESE